MDLSIIVPVYNEEDSLTPLCDALVAALEPTGRSFEMIFVDDGSADGTFARAEEIAARDPRLRLVKLRRNYGQTPAMVAGIDHATGEILITMDGDLQNDPADIPDFLEKIAEGYDIVVGWRHKRQDRLITRKLPSMIANRLIAKVTGVPIRDNGCSLKAYRANVIKNIPLYSDMHRFIPAMSSLAGTRVAQIRVRHHARQFGTSKYGLSRIYKVLFDLIAIRTILTFSCYPVLWSLGLSAAPMLIAISAFAIAADRSLLGDAGSSTVLLEVGMTFAALSVFLLFIGFLSQLVSRTGEIEADTFAMLTTRLDRYAPARGPGAAPDPGKNPVPMDAEA